MKKIHVGFLLSYDYELLKIALPPVYKSSDRIFIAIDQDYLTWSGNKFTVEPSFFDWLKEFDVDHKIELYFDTFYVPNLTTTQMDTRERKKLSDKMGIGNWLIQIDSDEYFIDFEGFVKQIKKYDHYLDQPEKYKIQIAAFWVIIYKYTENGILYVDKPMKSIFATNYPNYKAFRRTNERVIYLDSLVLHESVSRTEEELRYKLKNWSHNTHVNNSFLDKWLKVNESNYKEYSDFYYIEPSRWKTLDYFPTKNIEEINQLAQKSKNLRITKTYLFFKNFGQWFKFLFK
jgi:hypothetical protein